MKTNHFISTAVTSALLMCSCSTDDLLFDSTDNATLRKIQLSGQIEQVYESRANDAGFCEGDIVGIYVVDYEDSTPGTLLSEGNRADNVRHTFDENGYKWIPAYDIYWKDNKTNVDIYGYYPFAQIDNVDSYAFEVAKDQSQEASEGQMGGYESSDFLWGKTTDVAPTDRIIKLGFMHIMSSARVSLVEGSGFDNGEWAKLDKQVLILNTVRKSTINIATGEITPSGEVPSTGTIPYNNGDDFRAIVVPQQVAAGTPVISVTVGGVPYVLTKDEAVTYVPSKMLNFAITVNKRAENGGYEFILTSESITAWENDNVSHDAVAREYVVINVEKAGTLDECIVAAGKEVEKVRNLKITGQITSRDFAVMRYKMSLLGALNLKDVTIVAGSGGNLSSSENYYDCEDDEIPAEAMRGKETLTSLVLPDKLKKISGIPGGNNGAFAVCTNLSGSLIIPEGVEEIGCAAFAECTSLTGTLTLPSTLKK